MSVRNYFYTEATALITLLKSCFGQQKSVLQTWIKIERKHAVRKKL